MALLVFIGFWYLPLAWQDVPWEARLALRSENYGCNCLFQKTPSAEGLDKVWGSVDPRFAAGLPCPVPKILEFRGGKSKFI